MSDSADDILNTLNIALDAINTLQEALQQADLEIASLRKKIAVYEQIISHPYDFARHEEIIREQIKLPKKHLTSKTVH